MLFELLFQYLDPGQVITSVLVAVSSIVLRRAAAVFLPAFLSFLANLAVLIFLFLLFLSALFVLALLPPVP